MVDGVIVSVIIIRRHVKTNFVLYKQNVIS